jgi:hypothetical protein
MAPEAKGQDLLYVSDTSYGVGVVYVYSYPGGKLKGELSGVSPADGLCSDAKGNVFVPAGTSIAEYPHGGTQPIAVLSDPYGGADYCAVDRTTGNLAVSPTVVVYAHAKGKGKAYPGGNEYGNRSCTYDDKGDLFVNGISYVGSLSPVDRSRRIRPADAPMGVVELRKGRTRFSTIGFPVLLDFASIQWDGKYIAVGAVGPTDIGRFRIDRSEARIVAPWAGLELAGAIDQFWIQDKTVIVPSYQIPGEWHTAVYLYNYPTGGMPTKTIEGLNHPAGVTVSLAPK